MESVFVPDTLDRRMASYLACLTCGRMSGGKLKDRVSLHCSFVSLLCAQL